MARDCETAATPRRSPIWPGPSSPLRRCLVYLSHLLWSLPADSTRCQTRPQLFFSVPTVALIALGSPSIHERLSPVHRIHTGHHHCSQSSFGGWTASCGPCAAVSADTHDSGVNCRKVFSCTALVGRCQFSVGMPLSCLTSTLGSIGQIFCRGCKRIPWRVAAGRGAISPAVRPPLPVYPLRRSLYSHNVQASTGGGA
jgi:hypothetical protein